MLCQPNQRPALRTLHNDLYSALTLKRRSASALRTLSALSSCSCGQTCRGHLRHQARVPPDDARVGI